MNDGYGVCAHCLWNGKLRKDGAMRKHRTRDTSEIRLAPNGSDPQDMSAPICGGSYEKPMTFGCEADTTEEPQMPAPATVNQVSTSEPVWEAASFGDFAVGDRIRFQTIDNGFGGSGDFVSRTGTVTAVTARTLKVQCDWNWFGNRAVLRRAGWYGRDPQRAV